VAHEEWIGRIVDGRYSVESVIGAGGMGLVLRARHAFTGATVALKVVKPELELDSELQQRFLVEARAPSAIEHPAIVSVTDAGRAPDGLLYLAMELLVGRPLRVPAVRGELSAADIRRILLELLDVLGAAHAKGFVHRDLKPENVFLAGPNAQLKLLDFGIVKVLDAQLARVRTATGATLGTPAYMAPEQFANPRGVDARADLWAVGVMAYEMLAGSLPFRADTTHAMLLAIASQDPAPIRAFLPQAPPVLEQFFARALSRDPAGRFASAAEMAHAVAALPFGTAFVPRAIPSMPGRATAPAETPVALSVANAPTPVAGPSANQAAIPRPATPLTPLPPGSKARERRRWLIGLGLASLALISVIAAVATRSSESTPSSNPADTTPDTEKTPDPVNPPAPPADDQAAVDAQVLADCERGCNAAQTKCGNTTPTCAADCATNAQLRSCAQQSDGSCNSLSLCGMRFACGPAAATGTGRCRDALVCQGPCGDKVDCGCKCTNSMSSAHAFALSAIDVCAAKCKYKEDCIGRLCGNPLNACLSH
jgi:serine/threonine-protein kinase